MNNGDTVKFTDLQTGDYFRDNANYKYCKLPLYEMLPAEMQFLDLNLPSPPKFNAFDIQNHASVYIDPDASVIFIKHSSGLNSDILGFKESPEEASLDYQQYLYEDYFDAMEGFLQREADGNSKRLNELLANYRERGGKPLRPKRYLDEESFIADEIDEITADLQRIDEFADLLWKSFFISLYSFLEAQLNRECRDRQRENKSIKDSLEDIKGKGIERAKTYLVKVLKSSFPFGTSPQWQEVKLYGKLRNSLVHNEGKISDEDLRKYIAANSGLSCMTMFGEDRVVFGEGFCKHALSTIFALLRSMLYYREADEIC
jgi:hypothetical protein